MHQRCGGSGRRAPLPLSSATATRLCSHHWPPTAPASAAMESISNHRKAKQPLGVSDGALQGQQLGSRLRQAAHKTRQVTSPYDATRQVQCKAPCQTHHEVMPAKLGAHGVEAAKQQQQRARLWRAADAQVRQRRRHLLVQRAAGRRRHNGRAVPQPRRWRLAQLPAGPADVEAASPSGVCAMVTLLDVGAPELQG